MTAAVTALVVIAGVLLAALSAAVPINPAIALPWALGPFSGSTLGLGLWTALTLLGTNRIVVVRDGGRFRFNDAPIVAAMALGGPTAGAWVALVGCTEARELRAGVPMAMRLYGHASPVIAAALGAVAMGLCRDRLSATAPASLVPDLVAVGIGAAVRLGVGYCLAWVLGRITNGPEWRSGIRDLLEVLPTLASLACLGWVFARTFLDIAWWTPLLLAWPAMAVAAGFDRDRAQWFATHDPLTELPNRRELDARLSTMLDGRNRRAAAVLLVDLDGFKGINDRLGHAAGDVVLQTVGERLRATTRPGDLQVRLGGDEFVVVAEGVIDREVADALARRIHEAITQPICVRDEMVTVGGSIGIVCGDGARKASDVLLREADQAMYQAKLAGGGIAHWAPSQA